VSSVEPLSPMALHDAQRSRLKAVCLTSCGGFRLRSIGDNRSTKKPNSVELLSPMALHDAQRRRLTAVCLTSCGDFRLRSIGDNRSTKKPNSVEPLSPIALHDAPVAASYGCSVLAPRATLLCRCASANRGCCLKPPIKGGLANQRGLTFDFPE
jgi:hypothetical protein